MKPIRIIQVMFLCTMTFGIIASYLSWQKVDVPTSFLALMECLMSFGGLIISVGIEKLTDEA